MTTDLNFTQVNDVLDNPIFSIDGGVISLNINELTNETYTDLTNTGIVELCFKLLNACYKAQVQANLTPSVTLTSFSAPFYGTVQNTSPRPTIEGSITVTGIIPLDIDELGAR